MRRIILAVVIVVGGQSVQAIDMHELKAMIAENEAKIAQLNSGKSYGISEELYQKVMQNEILMTDAIDITRSRNGIDITKRGNNWGPMSPAGERILREGNHIKAGNAHGGIADLDPFDEPKFPNKQAKARERAAKRRAAK